MPEHNDRHVVPSVGTLSTDVKRCGFRYEAAPAALLDENVILFVNPDSK